VVGINPGVAIVRGRGDGAPRRAPRPRLMAPVARRREPRHGTATAIAGLSAMTDGLGSARPEPPCWRGAHGSSCRGTAAPRCRPPGLGNRRRFPRPGGRHDRGSAVVEPTGRRDHHRGAGGGRRAAAARPLAALPAGAGSTSIPGWACAVSRHDAAVAEPRRVGAMVRIAGISDFGWVAHIVVADPHTVEIRLAGANSTAGTSASPTGPNGLIARLASPCARCWSRRSREGRVKEG